MTLPTIWDLIQVFEPYLFRPFSEAVGSLRIETLTTTFFNRFVCDHPDLEAESRSYAEMLESKPVFKYLKEKVVPHKIAVYDAGLRLYERIDNCSYFPFTPPPLSIFQHNLLVHDLSKFTPIEAFGYADHNFSETTPPDPDFEAAWHHHKMNNPHHPEYWLNPSRNGQPEPIPMPRIYMLEMIADWIGAGTTYGKTLEEWLPDNLYKFRFHPNTLPDIIEVLAAIGIPVEISRHDITSGQGFYCLSVS